MMNAVEKLAAATKVVTHYLHRNESELLRQLPDDFLLRVHPLPRDQEVEQLHVVHALKNPITTDIVSAYVYHYHIELHWDLDIGIADVTEHRKLRIRRTLEKE
jgi:hypothetical protein